MNNKLTRKPITLPELQRPDISYTLKAIERSSHGYNSKNGSMMIDEGYGDHNMSLFRRKNKVKYVREMPSAFTPDIRASLEYRSQNDRERRLVTEHNEKIQNILRTPKEVYIEKMRKEQEERERRKKSVFQYVKGKNSSLKEENEHLGFRYVTQHQADNWFQVQDNSAHYEVPIYQEPMVQKVERIVKKRKKKGYIFASDSPKLLHPLRIQ